MGRSKQPEPIIQRPIEDFMCLNNDCPHFGKRNSPHLCFRGYSNKTKTIRLILCKRCKDIFSERKGTPLYRSQIDIKDAVMILEHLSEGVGQRATARLTRINRDTVARLAKLSGGHAKSLHDELVAKSPKTREVQMDEKWSFVQKKQKSLSEKEKVQTELGDRWDHVAIDAESKLVLAIIPGKRTDENCEKLVQEVARRTEGREDLYLTSDEHGGYEKAIVKVYGSKQKKKKVH